MKLVCVVMIASCCLALSPAQAQQVVTNGGFETTPTEYGVPVGWSTDAPSGILIFEDNGSFATRYGAPGPHTGAWDVVIGPYSDLWITQSVATQAGKTYDVSFWLYNRTGGTSDFSAYWGGSAPVANETGNQDNGQQIVSLTNTSNSPWTQYTGTFTAGSSSTELTFFGTNGTYFFGLDDVSVTTAASSATPEPGSLALLTGFAASGVAIFVRQKRKV